MWLEDGATYTADQNDPEVHSFSMSIVLFFFPPYGTGALRVIVLVKPYDNVMR